MNSPNINTKEAKANWLRPITRISPPTSPRPPTSPSPKRGRTPRRRYTGKKGRFNTPYPRRTRKKNRTPSQ